MGLICFLCLCIHSKRSVSGKPFGSDNRTVDGRKFATSTHAQQAHTHWHAYTPYPLGSMLCEWKRSRRGGRAKHVNYATPTATHVFQHCTSGQGVLNRQLHWHCLFRVRHTPDMLLLLRTFFRQPSRICCHRCHLVYFAFWNVLQAFKHNKVLCYSSIVICLAGCASHATHCTHDAGWEAHCRRRARPRQSLL